MADILALALNLRRLGLSIIPVPRPNGQCDGKVPAIPWREFQHRLPTEVEVAWWFGGTPMNIAIVTGGVSGVVVVDCDSVEALHWWTLRRPWTAWQTKTARGFHLFYRHSGTRVANRAKLETGDGRLAIDVRGDGGYVIAPGSVHASGVEYQCAGDWSRPRDSLPVFWPGWVQRPRPALARPAPIRRIAPAHTPTGQLLERARRYLRATPLPEIGCGSDTATFDAACRLVRGFQLSAVDAEELLWEWAGGRPGWTRDWIAEKVAHAVRYGSEPFGALR